MPRNLDWKDYIPASGEAHAQIGLKGRFGGKSNMYRRRSFARGRRFRHDGRRVWICDTNSLMPTAAVQIGIAGTTLFTGISPRLSLPTPTTTTIPFDQKHRLVGIQGSIPVWRDASDETVSLLPGSDSGVGTGRVWLFYIWKKAKLTSDALSAQATGNNEPTPDADLQVMLQGDDILNWGFRHIKPTRINMALDGLGGSASFNDVPTTNFFDTVQTFIPKPRIPRLGITLGRDDAIVCYVALRQWSVAGQEWVLPVSQNNAYFAQPLLRARYAL